LAPHVTARPLLAVVASVFATAAAAQAEPDVLHDGTWSATIRSSDGGQQSARFVLRQFGGDWIGAGGRKPATGSACAGKKLPITVQASTAGALEFTVWGSQISPKCANLTIETRSVGADIFEGTVESVGTIRVTRR
jgi:hypothetical protein